MIARRRLWFAISLVLLVTAVAAIGRWGLPLGIDFTGGSLATYTLSQTADGEARQQGRGAIERAYQVEGVANVTIITSQTADSTQWLVKSAALSAEVHQSIVRRLNGDPLGNQISVLSFESIDPLVGREVANRALWAIGLASLAIVVYITLSFRGIPKPSSSLQFGVVAVVALLHDVAATLGFYAIAGHFFGWQVNSEFVTAILTVMGFSVHDTIVVFDRLRENLLKSKGATFEQVAEISVRQTTVRSLNTSLTVVLVLVAVVLLGGPTIRPFAATLTLGIVIGTYSSIFVATPLLVWWRAVKPKLSRGWPKIRPRVAAKRHK